MQVSISTALSRAYRRTLELLFDPVDLSRWIHMGFSAWLISLAESGGGLQLPMNFANFSTPTSLEGLEGLAGRLAAFDLQRWAAVLAVVIALLLGIAVIFTWISCRGRFMLLDQIVHARSDVVRPWRAFRVEALSQLFWRLGAGVLLLAIYLSGLVLVVVALFGLFAEKVAPPSFLAGLSALTGEDLILVSGVLGVLLLLMGVFYVMLDDLALPLMWKHRTGTGEALGRVVGLVTARPFAFAAFLLVRVALGLGAIVALALFGLLTCCIGLAVLAIPFVGAVVLLPVTVGFRLFALYFLAQFGPQYDVFAGIQPNDALDPGPDPPDFQSRQDPTNPYSPVR